MVTTETYYEELKGTVNGSVKTVVSDDDCSGEALFTSIINSISASGKTVYTVTPIVVSLGGNIILGDSCTVTCDAGVVTVQ